MKLTKRQLKKLIEGVLSEEDTDPGDGQTADVDKTDPDVGPNVGKGGYLAQQIGYFPKAKQEFEIYGLKCKIEHSDAKRIRSVRVTIDAEHQKNP